MEKGLVIITNEHYNEVDMFDIERNKGKFVNLKKSKLDKGVLPEYRGRLSSRIIDTGGGYEFHVINIHGEITKCIELDYCEAQELKVLLKLSDEYDETIDYITR